MLLRGNYKVISHSLWRIRNLDNLGVRAGQQRIVSNGITSCKRHTFWRKDSIPGWLDDDETLHLHHKPNWLADLEASLYWRKKQWLAKEKSGTLADWITLGVSQDFLGCSQQDWKTQNVELSVGCNSPMSENSPLKIVEAQKSSSTGSKSPVLSFIHWGILKNGRCAWNSSNFQNNRTYPKFIMVW